MTTRATSAAPGPGPEAAGAGGRSSCRWRGGQHVAKQELRDRPDMGVALRQVLGLSQQSRLLVERPRLRAHRVVGLVAELGQPQVARPGREAVARNQARGELRDAVEVGNT